MRSVLRAFTPRDVPTRADEAPSGRARQGLFPIELPVEKINNSVLFLLIFAVGIAIRLLMSLHLGTYTSFNRYEMERAALSLARTGRLADPYMVLPTGYTAHVAPGYALVLAAIFRFFGEGTAGQWAKEFVSSAAAVAQYALFPIMAPTLGISRSAGLAAAIFGMALPLKYSTEVMGEWEATFAGLALTLLIWATATQWNRRQFSIREAALVGIGWGAGILISSALLTVMLAVAAVGLFVAGWRTRRLYAIYAIAMLIAAGLTLTPWAWRNELRLGSPIFTRSNLGLELRFSNHDAASPLEWMNTAAGNYLRYHPSQNLAEAEAVRSMGEAAYNRDRLRTALAWMKSHPARLAQLTFYRFLYTWFPNTPEHKRDKILWCETVAAALGLIALWGTRRNAAALLTATLIGFTALYYFIQVIVRYRYPVDWILLLLSAHFAAVAAGKILAERRVRAKGGAVWRARAT